MVTLELPFTYDSYINPHSLPLKLHLRNWALEIKRKSVRARVWASLWEVWGWWVNPRSLLSKKFVKVSKTCKSLLKCIFDKLSCVKQVLTNFYQFFELHKTNFSSWLWRNTFSIESQEILIQIEWDLFHCDLEEKIFHMN